MQNDDVAEYEQETEETAVEIIEELTPEQQRIEQILLASRKKTGAKLIELDAGVIERLASIMCTIEEIAAVMEVSIDTIKRNYRYAFETGRLKGKSSLRRHQWKVAENGNPAMLIWLGKQYLNQTEKIVTAEDPNIRNIPDISRLTINERKEILMRVKNSDIGEKQVENAKDKEATRPSESTVQSELRATPRKNG